MATAGSITPKEIPTMAATVETSEKRVKSGMVFSFL
jgi:hypothetical protein